MPEESVAGVFGSRLRIRVCGMLRQADKILMIKHLNVGDGFLWAPPGGGLTYGESVHEALRREFAEETHLDVQIGAFICAHEFLKPPLHAIELFFWVEAVSGILKLGTDPEMSEEQQFMDQIEFLSFDHINDIPSRNKHDIFNHCRSIEELGALSGFYAKK